MPLCKYSKDEMKYLASVPQIGHYNSQVRRFAISRTCTHFYYQFQAGSLPGRSIRVGTINSQSGQVKFQMMTNYKLKIVQI